MEIRRMGYLVLKLTRAEQKLRDQERERTMVLAKATRPEHLQAIAQSRLTLRKAAAGQIIQMTNHGIALRE
jgi:hypothetical protein